MQIVSDMSNTENLIALISLRWRAIAREAATLQEIRFNFVLDYWKKKLLGEISGKLGKF